MPKTWSMCPWVYTTVPRRSVFHPRMRSWLPAAITWLPVSTSSSPSSVSKAQMLPNDALKAVRSATSASPRSWVTGWWPPTSVDPSPFHSRSAISSRSCHRPRRLAQSAAMAFTGFGKGAIGVLRRPRGEQHAASGGWPTRRATRTRSGARWRSCSQDVADEFGEAKLFRPNRDTRFSKDKTPYKTNIAAVIYLRRRRLGVRVARPPRACTSAAAAYHLERPQLARLREAIDDDRTGKQIEASSPTLRKAKADVTAHDAVKTAPRGYSPDHPRIDLLRLGGLAGDVRPPARRLAPHRQGQGPGRRRLAPAPTPQRLARAARLTTSVRVRVACATKLAQTSGSTSGRGRGWLGGCRCRRGGGRGRGW